VVAPQESVIFDPYPETLWQRLTGQTH
jgi:hypothetical protein